MKDNNRTYKHKCYADILSMVFWNLITLIFCVGLSFILKKGDLTEIGRILYLSIGFSVLLLDLICVISTGVEHFCSVLIIENDQIIYKTGWLTKKTTIIPSKKIRSCSIRKSFMQRLCGLGDISVTTAGDTAEIIFASLEDADEACAYIMEIIK